MSSNGGPTVAVKLFVDKEKKRVLFAESDKDFVDVLFSFLTLPLGTIVRLFNKQSQIGCLDELYRSVESLGEDHFQTTACKAMLLRPVNAAALHCDRLKVKVDDADLTAIYVCLQSGCSCCSPRYFSPVRGVTCSCGATMNGTRRWPQSSLVAAQETADGIFCKGGSKFIITDDLHVAPSTTSLMFSLMDKLGLHEELDIKEEVLHLNSNKIISLLRRALLSKHPLTGLYFDVAITRDGASSYQLPHNLFAPQAIEAELKFKPITIKLVQTKDNSSVLYAEVKQDLVDLFFGLLCIPVGSILKTYTQLSPDGCLDNLYKSVNGAGCVKQDCRNLLLSPKLAPFFGCSSNVLQVEELPRRCHNSPSYHYEMNPKSPKRGDEDSYRAYVNGGSINFIVTDDLCIVNFSLAKSLQAIRAAKIPKGKLVEKELTLDKTQVSARQEKYIFFSPFSVLYVLNGCFFWQQVLKLLRAVMITRNALSSVLLPPI
ncbi:hypothetical protein CFC21_008854 [Triticum aestivum]|uniref:DUF674 domain-containing protein n=2 Tax=Triticum aestivum TaxID=4565 RepID=A0A9R1DH77_WHEAT|nr:hypothetical protein CFC21_008853 [Triticum aestivum]KAF6991808.1 hypothetical protein CFC21_008854 [Triticum aestivum]